MVTIAGVAGLDCVRACLGERRGQGRHAILGCTSSEIVLATQERYDLAVWNGWI